MRGDLSISNSVSDINQKSDSVSLNKSILNN